MKIFAHLTFRPGADIEAFMSLRAEEARTVWELYELGVLREAALRSDRQGALLTFEAASEDEVRALVETLPAVRAGLFRFELIAVGPFSSYATLFQHP